MVSHGIMAGFQSGHGWNSPARMPGGGPDKFLFYGKMNPDMTVQFLIWHLHQQYLCRLTGPLRLVFTGDQQLGLFDASVISNSTFVAFSPVLISRT